MDYRKLAASIKRHIENKPGDHAVYIDLLSLCRQWETEDFQVAHEVSKELRVPSTRQLRRTPPKGAEHFYEAWRKNLLFDAPHNFDISMTYIKLDRKPEKRFYVPRRHHLKLMVQGSQDIPDKKLRLLAISVPKRVGRPQTSINLVNMFFDRSLDHSTLMEGTGDDLIKSLYDGCLEYLMILNEYLFYDVFPDARLVQAGADTKIINLKSKSRFPTIMCCSIDACQTGLSEATNALYLDDRAKDREEAKNRQRLDDKWEVVSGGIMGWVIEGTPMVLTGTRCSICDPIERVQEYAVQENWPWRAIEIPAPDLITDGSNYEYERGSQKIFTTAYFREQREPLSAE